MELGAVATLYVRFSITHHGRIIREFATASQAIVLEKARFGPGRALGNSWTL